MSFKKPIQTTLLGFALCFCLLVGIGQNPILAATLIETEPTKNIPNLKGRKCQMQQTLKTITPS